MRQWCPANLPPVRMCLSLHLGIGRREAMRPLSRVLNESRRRAAVMLKITDWHALSETSDCDKTVIDQVQNLEEHRGLPTQTD